MTKYILAGGRIDKSLDEGKAFVEELIAGFDKRVQVLVCPFARKREEWPSCLEGDQEFFSKFTTNFELVLADPAIFTEQVKKANVIFFRGGYPEPLLELLKLSSDWINYLEGKTVAGTSAGAEILAKYYSVSKNGRIGEGLGILPIKFSPHWLSTTGDYEGVNWEERMDQLHAHQEDLPMVLLKEGEFKVFM
jgi:peptidase E